MLFYILLYSWEFVHYDTFYFAVVDKKDDARDVTTTTSAPSATTTRPVVTTPQPDTSKA